MRKTALSFLCVVYFSLFSVSVQAGITWNNSTGDNMWNTIANWGANPVGATDIFAGSSPAGTVFLNADFTAARIRQNVGAPARTVTIAATNMLDATMTLTGATELFDHAAATADFTWDGTANGNGAKLKMINNSTLNTVLNTNHTLTLNLDVSGTGGFNVTKGGGGNATNGTLVLGGINTYSGNTTVVADQNITLLDNAQLTFYIGANGVNNSISGAGKVTLAGDFSFNLSLADLTSGNSWNIVNVATLNETFDLTTFSVLGGFTESSDVWTWLDGNNLWEFTEGTGLLELTVVPEPSAITLCLVGGLGLWLTSRRRRLS